MYAMNGKMHKIIKSPYRKIILQSDRFEEETCKSHEKSIIYYICRVSFIVNCSNGSI